MQKYDVVFDNEDVIVTRILDEEGDVFYVRNQYKEHVGRVLEGTVEVTNKKEGTVIVLNAGDDITVRIGDEWDCIAKTPVTITSCRLNVEDPETWKEVGLSRQEVERRKEAGYFDIRQKTRLHYPEEKTEGEVREEIRNPDQRTR